MTNYSLTTSRFLPFLRRTLGDETTSTMRPWFAVPGQHIIQPEDDQHHLVAEKVSLSDESKSRFLLEKLGGLHTQKSEKWSRNHYSQEIDLVSTTIRSHAPNHQKHRSASSSIAMSYYYGRKRDTFRGGKLVGEKRPLACVHTT